MFITEAIGSTETGFAGHRRCHARTTSTAAGPTVTPGPDVIVLDDDNRPVGPGQVGRLARGGHVPLGYYKDPDKTAAMFVEVDGKRYAMPGDLARVEEDGTLTLLGRGNTCVNSGGEKVFPEEVEGALKSHPDVFDALVIGVPDERLGQRVAALVQPGPATAPDLGRARRRTSAASIAGYKVPRSIWLAGTIRRTAVRQGRLRLGPRVRRQRRPSRPWTRAGEEPVRTPSATCSASSTRSSAFTPSEHVAAAISRAGGLGVLGCVRFNDPAELDAVLDWMDEQHRRPAVRRRRGDAGQGPDRGRAAGPEPADPAGAPGLRRADAAQARRAAAAGRRGPPTACSAGCTRSPARTSTSRWPTPRG